MPVVHSVTKRAYVGSESLIAERNPAMEIPSIAGEEASTLGIDDRLSSYPLRLNLGLCHLSCVLQHRLGMLSGVPCLIIPGGQIYA